MHFLKSTESFYFEFSILDPNSLHESKKLWLHENRHSLWYLDLRGSHLYWSHSLWEQRIMVEKIYAWNPAQENWKIKIKNQHPITQRHNPMIMHVPRNIRNAVSSAKPKTYNDAHSETRSKKIISWNQPHFSSRGMKSWLSILHLKARSTLAPRASLDKSSFFFSVGTNRWLISLLSLSRCKLSSISLILLVSMEAFVDADEETRVYVEKRPTASFGPVGSTSWVTTLILLLNDMVRRAYV